MDIKGENLIKGVQLEGLRVLGNPNEFARKYYENGIDEIIFMDAVASLYNRNNLVSIISEAAKDIFIPITVGGGIRCLEDAQKILRSGADKVAINTAAINSPGLISSIAHKFGSQCVVASIEAKRNGKKSWEAYTNNGREKTGLDVLEWSKTCELNGAGEILMTSVDQEGTRKGFDLDLIKNVSTVVNIPIIASGGMGCLDDINRAFENGADAIAIADHLHYQRSSILEIREKAIEGGFKVRKNARL